MEQEGEEPVEQVENNEIVEIPADAENTENNENNEVPEIPENNEIKENNEIIENNEEEMRPTQHFGQQRISVAIQKAAKQPPQKPKHIYAKFDDTAEDEAGYSKPLVSLESEGLDETLVEWPFASKDNEGVQTLFQAFKRNLFRTPYSKLFGARCGHNNTYEWMTYREVADNAEHFSYGLKALDMIPDVDIEGKTYRFIAIFCKNRMERYLAHVGNMYQNVTTIAIYQNLNDSEKAKIFEDTQCTTMLVSYELLQKVIKLKSKDTDGKLAKLTNLITFCPDHGHSLEDDGQFEHQSDDEHHHADDAELKQKAEEAGLTIYQWVDIINKGRSAENPTVNEPGIDDCHLLSYSSGSSGVPKGSMITHKMAIQQSVAFQKRLGSKKLTEKDSYYAYISNAPGYEHSIFSTCLIYSVKIAFYNGKLELPNIQEDLNMLKPTFFPLLPALLFKLFQKIQEELKSAKGCKYWFVEKCCNTKLDSLESGGYVTNMITDNLIFNKIKAILGGQVRIMLTNATSISPEILKFLKICFCVDIQEAYGCTETASISCMTSIEKPNPSNIYNDARTSIVGSPLSNTKIKLKDLEELNFLSSNDPPQGEICIQGPSVIENYFKNEEASGQNIIDGWFHTGDIGEVQLSGSIRILDRVSSVFKLQNGDQILPTKLENIYLLSEFVQQIFVYGESAREYLVAIIVVPDQFNTQLDESKYQDFRKAVIDDLTRISIQFSLEPFEKLKNIKLQKEKFSVHHQHLTPIMDFIRISASKLLADDLNALYDEGSIVQPNLNDKTSSQI